MRTNGWLTNVHTDQLKDFVDQYDFCLYVSRAANTLISDYMIGLPHDEAGQPSRDMLLSGWIGIYR